MKYVIFGDIHSNYEALKTFFLLTDPLKNIQRICLGDIVGYAAHPNECLEMIHRREIPTVMGNHEYAIINPVERETFNHIARTAIEWQYSQLTRIHCNLIGQYPYVLPIDDLFTVTHADFHTPETFSYLNSEEDARFSFAELDTQIGFFGHTHLPMIFIEDHDRQIECLPIYGNSESLPLEEGKRYLINPGSLGQPRDGNCRAAYAMLDSEEMTITFHRIDYDIEKEMESIKDADLPEILADRLKIGF